jgi:hypothetical protein
MEKITKENLEAWIKENNWLQTDEADTPDGHQIVYLTPAGEFIYVQHSLNGEIKIFKRMPVPVQGGQQRRIINLGGGQPGFLG